ncbi:hypothetical protein UT300005_14350 [Clostridium sp. CTA-5]
MIQDIVEKYAKKGVEFWSENNQLRFRAPVGALDAQDKNELRINKDELLKYFSKEDKSALKADLSNRFEPFPLTEIQSAYLLGRNSNFEYGGVGCHAYFELTMPVMDEVRLEKAWHKVIMRHDMLRSIILKNGMQQILRDVMLPKLKFYDMRGLNREETDKTIKSIREELSEKQYATDKWPLYDLYLTTTEKESIVHFSVDMLISDFISMNTIMNDLDHYYYENDKELENLEVSFRDVLLFEREQEKLPQKLKNREKDYQYWLKRIEKMPESPELPVLTEKKSKDKVVFKQYKYSINKEQWEFLCNQARVHRITPSGTILAAYSEVIGRWSKQPNFCIDITILNRPNIHHQINNIVGDFTEVDILEISPKYPSNFSERAMKVQTQLWEDLGHNSFNGINVLREINRQHNKKVIIPVVYTSTIGVGDKIDKSKEFMRDAQLTYKISQTPQVWIDCQVSEQSNGGILINWDVRDGVFPHGMIEDIFNSFTQLIQRMTIEKSVWYEPQPVKLPDYTEKTRKKVNKTDKVINECLLQQGFLKQVQNRPDAIALISEGKSYTYKELAEYVSSIQQGLIDNNCKKGDFVGIVLEKGVWQIAAVLGTLLTGGVYLPIDASQPIARQNRILENANVKFLITHKSLHDSEWKRDITIISAEEQRSLNKELINISVNPNSPAYIIHTSGTTGKPKGVVVSHKAAMNTIIDINEKFNVTSSDKIMGLANLAFDLSVYDIFGIFTAGGTLILPDPKKQKDPNHWCDIAINQKVTIWNSVPAQMQMFISCLESRNLDEQQLGLRFIMLSGDWIPVTLPKAIRNHCKKAEIVSLGGATEAAIWSIYHVIDEVKDNATSIPYGKPLSNQSFYVLNEWLQPCPDWTEGDLYIGGIGLAIEYLGDEKQTKEKFIYHPETNQRLYQTGDLGRYLPNGTIEFLGRKDTQVKIHGHRIELSEIESILQNHYSIESAVALVIGDSPINYRIIAFVQGNVTEPELKKYLELQLPQYMVPSRIEVLKEIPLSANGKVNRKLLKQKANEFNINEVKVGEPPRDLLEKNISKIWCEALDHNVINRDDDFYDIGGDSLLVAQVVAKMKEVIPEAKDWEWDRLMIALLKAPTIAGIARELRINQKENISSITDKDKNKSPLTIIADAPKENGIMKVFFPGGIGTLRQFNTLIQNLLNDPNRTEGIMGFNYSNDPLYLKGDDKNHIINIAQRYAKHLIKSGYKNFKLIGYCMGGLIAIEVARVLLESGIDIEPVVTIDTIPIVLNIEGDILMERSFGLMTGADIVKAGHVKENNMIKDMLENLKNEKNGLITEDMILSLDGSLKELADCYNKQKQISQETRLNNLKDAILANGGQLQENELEKLATLFYIYRRNYRSSIGYMPMPFVGDLHALSCVDKDSPFVPVMKPGTEEFLKQCAIGDLKVTPIEGNHLICMQSPYAENLAKIL